MAMQSLGIAMPAFWMSKTSFVISALLFGATFMGITTLATTVGREMTPSDSSRTIGILSAIYAIRTVNRTNSSWILIIHSHMILILLLLAQHVLSSLGQFCF